MSSYRPLIILTLVGCFSAACQDHQDDINIQPYRARLSINNGLWPNGLWPNGLWPNGLWPNGLWPNGTPAGGFALDGLTFNGIGDNGSASLTGHISGGVTVNGILISSLALNGALLTDVDVTASQLSGTISSSKDRISGAALKGLSAQVTIPDPGKGPSAKFSIRIDNAYLDTNNKFKDVWLYQASYKINGTDVWNSLCLDYAGNPAPITPVIGSYWDSTTGSRIDNAKSFSLACYEGAVAKCVSAGYRPWATLTQCAGVGKSKKCVDVSLKDYHQACTRMIRADYCGDGIPHTVNGTILDIFDYLSPPVQLQEEKWQLEARWKPNGAICLSQPRHPEIAFPGCLRVTDQKKPASYVQLPKCQPYATGDDRGLIVSTFDSMSVQMEGQAK